MSRAVQWTGCGHKHLKPRAAAKSADHGPFCGEWSRPHAARLHSARIPDLIAWPDADPVTAFREDIREHSRSLGHAADASAAGASEPATRLRNHDRPEADSVDARNNDGNRGPAPPHEATHP